MHGSGRSIENRAPPAGGGEIPSWSLNRVGKTQPRFFPTGRWTGLSCPGATTGWAPWLVRTDRHQEGETQLLLALQILEQHGANVPASRTYQGELAFYRTYVGDLFLSTGRSEEAKKYYRLAVETRKKLVDDFPNTAEYGRRLMPSRNRTSWESPQTGGISCSSPWLIGSGATSAALGNYTGKPSNRRKRTVPAIQRSRCSVLKRRR